ncbi:MAG TPA: glutamine amidotransferase [Syntrophaceticus sp.]|nr:glutamine amidotransferase [Syntrophaceticus schinkii]MDD4261940.1 glutamine amidotransferase [Syntrophaceticus schinkii]MDD4675170.1 glutamine amidotransferase [Syntrophaceticus schinkii]HHY29587.1 glutamine amidotransferase [Syntrophaceticus sp.]
MRIRVCHLYPDLFNLHGDRGNLIVLCRRAEWRGIQVDVDDVSLGEKSSFIDYDFIFLGGGAEQYLDIVVKDLQVKKPCLLEAVEEGTVLLGVSLGFQVLGAHFSAQDGTVFPGAGIFDAHAEAKVDRMKGNILLELAADLQEEVRRVGDTPLTTVVGYENHSGRTFLGDAQPVGSVLKGWGNNGEDKTEGAVYKNAFGTYLHGPLLAKNPHLADLLLARALSRKGESEIRLTPLNDDLEIYAHNVIKKRLL